MEKKLKFAEFAELIGTTAKTVYKMEEREEIITVTEKVNNRPTRLVVTNDEQIEKFRNIYRKTPVNNGNYEEMLTSNEPVLNSNNSTQPTENNETIKEMFERIIEVNKEYNNHIQKLSEELIDSKSKLLLLEDKAGREGLYLKEINELKSENETLKNYTKRLYALTITVCVLLSLVLVGVFTYNVTLNSVKNSTEQKKEPIQQEIIQNVQKPATPARNNHKR